jgi:hypothetical protein
MLSAHEAGHGKRFHRRILLWSCLAIVFLLAPTLIPACAQEASPGPIAPMPGHEVHRIPTAPEPAGPPPVPPEEIIRRFSQKEDEFAAARPHFGFRRTIRVEEFGEDGKVSGEFQFTTMPVMPADGTAYEKIVEQSHSTLRYLHLEPEDFEALARVPLFPLATAQLAHYNITYAGKERVDEVNCYIFVVKPKVVERTRAYFDGLVWVDDQDLEVVRTYGKWVTDLGDFHSPQLPFTLFDTYRENVEGKYWFPDYARSDDSVRLKDQEVRVRVVIRWQDYAPPNERRSAALPSSVAAPASAPAATPPPTSQAPAH